MRINPKKDERLEIVVEGKVYVVATQLGRPRLVFSHLVREESETA